MKSCLVCQQHSVTVPSIDHLDRYKRGMWIQLEKCLVVGLQNVSGSHKELMAEERLRSVLKIYKQENLL